MTTYGLTTEGLITPTTVIIREGLNALLRNTFGASIDTGDRSILGQMTGILAERLASLWEQLEAVNSSQDPDKATGAALEALCALTGTFRPAASFSTVVLTLTGTPTTVVPSGNKSETDSTGKVFVHADSGTITAVSAWAAATYALGARVHRGGNVYQCIEPGTSVTGPTGTAADSTDGGTAHWTFLGAGTGAVDVNAVAELTGPTTAFARDIIVKNTSVAGWDGVINLNDANVGRNQATDGELRLLREQELATGGSSTQAALIAELLEVEGVIDNSVYVFVNNTDSTNADGMPPHSVEALVNIPVGADYDQRVFDALLSGVAAGIQTHSSGAGAASGYATDSQGTQHLMKFTRPAEVPIYINITVTVDPELFPADGADLIKQAIVVFGDAQRVGKDAVASAISAQAFRVDGVLDVSSCLIDDAPAPATSATVPITLRQLATYDTSRINVTVNNGTP